MIELLTIIRLSMVIGNILKNFKDVRKTVDNNIQAFAFTVSIGEAVIEVGLLILLLCYIL